MMNVMSGPDEQDYTCIRTAPPDFVRELDGSRKKLRIAWSPDLGYSGEVNLDSEVKSATTTAVLVFEELGHEVEETAPTIEPPFEVITTIFCAGSGVSQGSLLDEHADELVPRMRATLEIARGLNGIELAKAYMKADKWRRMMLDFFECYDLLITPTTSVPAFVPGSESGNFDYRWRDWGFFPFTQIFNITRNPAANVPCGFSSDGLPIGLQIIGRQEDDAMVLWASAMFEQARPWTNKRPPVS
jgi:aspartyl-tRNA(Asn)/glutamyl-tRNA(Gln) amidotransferase subunit A